MYEQQAFYNGEPIDFNNLDLWNKFKVTFGFNVTEKKQTQWYKNSILSIVDSLLLLRRLMALTGF
ncbi:hypothetical protein L1K73_22965 [Salmonella enterica subsp. enterica serovar Anatum]|nr:hypothetical protein [Salmonella enterica subsp. enterica serovar Anatum]HAD8393479.1 hypothetical protein [Salmonella enterica]MCF1802189.1 hypothetical protein [Salmonella enterica subsp. enterica serovar Anatum]MCF1806399.1 hypothetical protein [Salmonella enterica subsp. enterica serovar Anatum]MCF1820162.1 hypothetical protein [Salmonella enterica subsp. enterica serovar Anatum]